MAVRKLAAAAAAVAVSAVYCHWAQQQAAPPLGSRRALLATTVDPDPGTIDWISWAASKFAGGGSGISPHISALGRGDAHYADGGYRAASATDSTSGATTSPSRPAPPPALPLAPAPAPAPAPLQAPPPPPPIVLKSKLSAAFSHLDFPVASQREAEAAEGEAVAASSRARPPAAAADQQQQHRAKVNTRNRQTALTRSIGRAEKAATRKNPHAKNMRNVKSARHSPLRRPGPSPGLASLIQ